MSVIQSSWVSGSLSIEVNGRTVGTLENAHYIVGIHC